MIRSCFLSTSAFIVRLSAGPRIPGRNSLFPSARPTSLRQGKDITLITYGAVVPRALRAAQTGEQ